MMDKWIIVGLVAGSTLLLAGCTVGYNGALIPGDSGAREASRATTGNSAGSAQAAPANAPSLNFEHPAATVIPAADVTMMPMRPGSGADGVPRGLDPLNLYGVVPGVAGRVSPLDSADNITQVSFATEGADFDPALSPDGTLVAFASTRHRARADIYVQRVDGTAVRQLTDDPADDVMPVFSPDGKRIAFASNRAGNWDIYIMDVDGGKAMQVSSAPAHEIHPSFSPDGRQLVYSAFNDQSGQWELVLVEIDNPATRRFIGHGLFPHWSPVGNQIVFQRARERGTRWFSIWTMDIERGEGVRPTEIAASSNAACITPHWSPDGKHIVFCTVVNPQPGADLAAKPQQADLWVMNADGSGRTNLTRTAHLNVQPVWSRDGRIYFVSNRSRQGVENIWSIRPDSALQIARPPVGSADQDRSAVVIPER